jgi:ribonuclease J
MKLCVHRGTEQIGGTCIELESDGVRILLDLGRPLDADDADARRAVPEISGLRDGDPSLLGILLSHPHQDHVGLVEFVPANIPIAIGESASRILDAAAGWLGKPLLSERPLIHWRDREPFRLGPFEITPFLVDHSAYDAYALLIEADGCRVFYSGDFRGHGRKSAVFERLLASPPPDIDVLLMEGTVIGRDAEMRTFPSESNLEAAFVDRLRDAAGLSLLWTSSQNLDRIVTVYRACKRTGRRLILDAFTADMLAASGNSNLPQADWPSNIGVYVPEWMRRKIKRDQGFPVLDRWRANRVFLDGLDAPERDVLLFRPGLLKEVAAKAPLTGAQMLYSNWSGYLTDASTLAVREWLESERIPVHAIHTSGHASVPDLMRFAQALAPRVLLPIHSFHTDRFADLFANVLRVCDGDWMDVQSLAQHPESVRLCLVRGDHADG